MATLTHLPPELLHNIFSHVDPEDLARVPLACRALNNFVKGNNALCRAIYLRLFDEPPTRDLDFEQELHDIITLKSLCSPKDSSRDREIQGHLPFVYRTVTRLLKHAVKVPAATTTTTTTTTTTAPSSVTRHSRAQTFPPSLNASLLTTLFSEPAARLNFLSRSFLYEHARALGLDGLENTVHYLATAYPSDSGSESDPDPDPDNANAASSGRRQRKARTAFGWRRPRRPREEYQMSAKLHCLYGWGLGFEDGVTPGDREPEARRRAVWAARRGAGVYPVACAKVYDMRECTRGSGWGPFMGGDGGEDGVRVDWEKVEAILVVLGTNVRSKGLERFPIFWHFWGKPFAGCWGSSYIPWSRDKEHAKDKEKQKQPNPLDAQDPYGVSGSWLRIVSFLDYHDFVSFNFPIADRRPRDVPRAPLDAGQATRLILMRMRVTKVEPPGAADHPDHPVTHFTGFSRALDGTWDDNADSDLRGTVRTTKEGEVRWTSYSVFDGEERWKSEGVQVGGRRSARGVVGNWFDKDYSPQGPCGPTAFWKISDREATGEDKAQVLLEDLFPLIADDMDEELASEDDSNESGDDMFPLGLDPFGEDWAEYELEDELDAMYYFDDEDVFDVEDIEGEVAGLLDPDEDDDDEDEDEDEDEAAAQLTHS